MSASCKRLLAEAGESVPRRGRGAGVTSRETDVLQLIAEGRTNREIAERLYVSVNTIKTHIGNLLAKTGAPSRAAVAELWATHAADGTAIPSPPRAPDTAEIELTPSIDLREQALPARN
jgi:DNA-binding NarL/FixJ family response regulator